MTRLFPIVSHCSLTDGVALHAAHIVVLLMRRIATPLALLFVITQGTKGAGSLFLRDV